MPARTVDTSFADSLEPPGAQPLDRLKCGDMFGRCAVGQVARSQWSDTCPE
jgi:hypothetical protein